MIARRIKELRLSQDLTQKDLAMYLGLTPKMISFYELGQRIPPSDIILKLANKFNVSTDFLLGHDISTQKEKRLSPEREKLVNDICAIDDETAQEIQQYLNYLKAKKEQAATA